MSQVNLTKGDRNFILDALEIENQSHEITNDDLIRFQKITFEDNADKLKQSEILQQAGIELASLVEGGSHEVVIDLTTVEPRNIITTFNYLVPEIESGHTDLREWAASYTRWQEVVDLVQASPRAYNRLIPLIQIANYAPNLRLVLTSLEFNDESLNNQSFDEIVGLIQLGNEHLLGLMTAEIEKRDPANFTAFEVFKALAQVNHPGIAEKFRTLTKGITYTNDRLMSLMARFGHPESLEYLSKNPLTRKEARLLIIALAAAYELADATEVDVFGFSSLTLKKRYKQALYYADLSGDDIETRRFIYGSKFPLEVLNKTGNQNLAAFLSKYIQKSPDFLKEVLIIAKNHRGHFRNFAQTLDLIKLREIHGIQTWMYGSDLFKYFVEIDHPGIVDEFIFLYENHQDARFIQYCVVNPSLQAVLFNPKVLNFLIEKSKGDLSAFAFLNVLSRLKTDGPNPVSQTLQQMDVSAYAHLTFEQRKFADPLSNNIKDIWEVLVEAKNENIYQVIAQSTYEEPNQSLLHILLRHFNPTSKAYIEALGRIAEYDIKALQTLWWMQDPHRWQPGKHTPGEAVHLKKLSQTQLQEVERLARENFERAAIKNPQAVVKGNVDPRTANIDFHIAKVNDPSLGKLDKEDLHWKAIVTCSLAGNRTAINFINSFDENRIHTLIAANPLWLVRAMDIKRLNGVALVTRYFQQYPIAAFIAIAQKPDAQFADLLKSLDADFFINLVRSIPVDQPQLADALVKALIKLSLTRVPMNRIFGANKSYWKAVEEAFRIHRGKYVQNLVDSFFFQTADEDLSDQFITDVHKLIVEIVQTNPCDPDYKKFIDIIKVHIDGLPSLAKTDFSRLKQDAKEGNQTAFSNLFYVACIPSPQNKSLLESAVDAVVAHPNLALHLVKREIMMSLSVAVSIANYILLTAARKSLAVKNLLVANGIHSLGDTKLLDIHHPRSSAAEFFNFPKPATGATVLLSALFMVSPSFHTNKIEIDEPTLAATHQIEVFDDSNQTAATNVNLPLSVNLVNADNHDLENWRQVNLKPVERRDDDVTQRRNDDVRQSVRLASLRRQSVLRNAAFRRARFVVS